MRPLLLWLVLSLSTFGVEPAESLHLLCWSEYVPQSVLDGFTKTTGARVLVEYYTTNDQLLERLRARPGYYDLIQPSGYYVRILAETGGLEPLDSTHLRNLGNLDPAYRHLSFDPDGKYCVPWLAGTVGIVTNTELVNEPPTSFAQLFDGTHRGKIVVVDDAREIVAWALTAVRRPITDVSTAALREAEPVLRKWLPQVKVFDSDSPRSALLDGRAEVGIIWSGEAALLWQADHKFRFTLPAIGAHMFVDNLAIPKGAPHRELAEKFIDYCLAPEVSASISRAYPYTNPNAAARRLLSAEELANPASYPPGISDLPMLRNDGNTPEAVTDFLRRLREELGDDSKTH